MEDDNALGFTEEEIKELDIYFERITQFHKDVIEAQHLAIHMKSIAEGISFSKQAEKETSEEENHEWPWEVFQNKAYVKTYEEYEALRKKYYEDHLWEYERPYDLVKYVDEA